MGLIANLMTRELIRKEYVDRNLPPEHPKASSTDDVEGIISLFHEVMGDNCYLKQFYDEFPKVMSEFVKRIDPDLSFFYWTGHQTLPSFNAPSTSGVERLDKVGISRRGDPGVPRIPPSSKPVNNQGNPSQGTSSITARGYTIKDKWLLSKDCS